MPEGPGVPHPPHYPASRTLDRLVPPLRPKSEKEFPSPKELRVGTGEMQGAAPTPAVVPVGNYLLLDGAGYATTPDHASLDITGDIDIRIAVAMDDWTPVANSFVVAKNLVSGGQGAYFLRVNTDAATTLQWSTTGANGVDADFTALTGPPANGSLLLLKATLDVDDGALQRVANLSTKTSTPGGAASDLSANSGWTLHDTKTGAVTSIFASAADLVVGATNNGAAGRVAGKVYAAVVKSGIDGTTVANPDFSSQAVGTTSFTDGTGKLWTLNGTASIAA